MSELKGSIAVVTGASRGVGRGIALVLGEAGATVYVTGRSARGRDVTDGRSETVDETAEMVTARGGTGIAHRCDHTVDEDVESLFARVKDEQKRIDILVNNAWGGYEIMPAPEPFWELPMHHWELMFGAGLRAQMISARLAVPLMKSKTQALIVNTTAPVGSKYHGNVFYDVVKTAAMRMTRGMAQDLDEWNTAAVAIAPGWTRTERVLDAFKVDAKTWAGNPELENSESPEYSGRAVAALAQDANLMDKSGQCFEVGHLARDYAFTDVDGRCVPPFSELYPVEYGGA